MSRVLAPGTASYLCSGHHEYLPNMDSSHSTSRGNGPAKARNSLIGDIARLASGTTIAQALGILVSPVFTRLFPPSAFGISALYSSIVAVSGTIVCLRYELSIMLPKEERNAAQLLIASLGLTLGWATLGAVIVILFGYRLGEMLGAPVLGLYLPLLPLSLLSSGVAQSFRYWNNRNRALTPLTWAPVVSALLVIAVRLAGAGSGRDDAGVLVVAKVISGAAVAFLQLSFGIRVASRHWRNYRPRLVLGQMRRYIKFPLVSVCSELLNSISVQVPVFLLALFFTETVVGHYSLAARVVGLPSALVRAAVGQMFLQRASVAHREGKLGRLTSAAFRQLALLGLYPYLAVACVGDIAFNAVFGSVWQDGGRFAQLIAPWQYVVFVGSPLSFLYVIKERQEIGLAFNIALFLGRMAAFSVGGLLGNPTLAVALYGGIGTLAWLALTVWVVRDSGASLAIDKPLVASAALAAMVVVLVITCRSLFPHRPWLSLGVVGFGAVAYYAYQVRSNAIALQMLCYFFPATRSTFDG